MNNNEFRFISPEPKLAEILSNRTQTLMPKPLYEWAIGWLRDIGVRLRSRDMMASYIAYGIYSAGWQAILRVISPYLSPIISEFPAISRFIERVTGGAKI